MSCSYKISIFRITLALVVLFTTSSCQDYLNINEDPNNPSRPEVSKLLTGAQVNFIAALSQEFEPGAATQVQHILMPGWDIGIPPGSVVVGWDQLYSGPLIDLHNLIALSEETGDFRYSGVSKIMMAYIYSVLVDLFGTIPFSEALLGDDESLFNPKYEEGKLVYEQLFDLIDAGLNDLENDSEAGPAEDDLIFHGNIDLWKKAGNSLKLKLYNQLRLVDPDLAKSKINQLIEQGDLISSSFENFSFSFATSISPDNRHPLYELNYNSKRPLMGDFLGRTLISDRGDPRAPYYFYNQSTGFQNSFSDVAGNSLYGIYPVGGLFDDGRALAVNPSVATGAGIYPMITYPLMLFVMAESSLTLETMGDPKGLLEQGIRASMNDVEAISGVSMAVNAVNDYVNHRLIAYDSASNDESRLEIIMTEKYVSLFGNGLEAYNDLRRTGYPKINSGTNNFFPLRWTLPETELRFNRNAPESQDFLEPVFWDIN